MNPGEIRSKLVDEINGLCCLPSSKGCSCDYKPALELAQDLCVELERLRAERVKWRELALRLLPHCPHAHDHDSEPCPICGCRLTFDGIRAKWRDG